MDSSFPESSTCYLKLAADYQVQVPSDPCDLEASKIRVEVSSEPSLEHVRGVSAQKRIHSPLFFLDEYISLRPASSATPTVICFGRQHPSQASSRKDPCTIRSPIVARFAFRTVGSQNHRLLKMLVFQSAPQMTTNSLPVAAMPQPSRVSWLLVIELSEQRGY